jgi:hypothetical protein
MQQGALVQGRKFSIAACPAADLAAYPIEFSDVLGLHWMFLGFNFLGQFRN